MTKAKDPLCVASLSCGAKSTSHCGHNTAARILVFDLVGALIGRGVCLKQVPRKSCQLTRTDSCVVTR